MNPSLKSLIAKHLGHGYKEVYYKERRLVLFYDVQKDESGHEYFDDFFVTDLKGDQLSNFTDAQFEELKRLV